MAQQIKILFVCMGNICRSPMAEGVFKHFVAQSGLQDLIASDSAGTHDYHVGDPPDPRALRASERRGYDLSALRGRQVSRGDFSEFDYLLAMDETNLRVLERLCPSQHAHKLKLFMTFSTVEVLREVPDPYYGGGRGFDTVLDYLEDAAKGLLQTLV